jgi:hypothetical protein
MIKEKFIKKKKKMSAPPCLFSRAKEEIKIYKNIIIVVL